MIWSACTFARAMSFDNIPPVSDVSSQEMSRNVARALRSNRFWIIVTVEPGRVVLLIWERVSIGPLAIHSRVTV